jgi:8-oxo-dGTP diphosphatase
MTVIHNRIKELGFEAFRPEDRTSVAVVVTNPEGKYLIMQRSFKDTDGAGFWDIPGGSVDSDDIHDSAVRELHEEAGIKTDALDYFSDIVYNCPWINDDKVRFIFSHKTSVTPVISFEHEEYKWVTIEELDEHVFFLDYLKNAVKDYHAKNVVAIA